MKRLIFLLIALLLRIEVIHGQTRKWMPMPQEVNGIVTSLAVYQGQLIVAGAFTKAGQVSVNKIAAWDGVKWSSLGSGMRGGLYSGVEGIYVHDSLLYVEGFFDSAGTVSAKGLAIWNGKEWKNPLKNGHLDTLRVIHSLIEYKNEIYAGGNYSQIGGIKANGIAKWDGMNWHSLGTNKYTDAQNLYVYNNELYMLGSLDLGGSITDYIGRWDGISWKKVSTGVGYQHKAMINWKGKLLIGAHTPHQIPPVDYRDIVEWNSDTIIRFSRQVMINLYNFHIFEKELYCFGGGGVMKWSEDSLKWEYEGQGLINNIVMAMIEYNGELFCGGTFNTSENSTINFLGRYTEKVGSTSIVIEPKVRLFPNPIKSMLSIQGSEIVHIRVVNSSGQIVKQEEMNGFEYSDIDLSHLSNGIYIIELISSDGKLFREKIVKD